MAPTVSARKASPAAHDDLEDLFEYDPGRDNVFQEDNTARTEALQERPKTNVFSNDAGAGLGIDHEIKIAKKRRPVAKLDEARYVSATFPIVAILSMCLMQ